MSQRRNSIKRWLWQGLKLAVAVAVVGYVIYWVRFSPVLVSEHQIERGEIVAEVMGTGRGMGMGRGRGMGRGQGQRPEHEPGQAFASE